MTIKKNWGNFSIINDQIFPKILGKWGRLLQPSPNRYGISIINFHRINNLINRWESRLKE